MPSTEQEKILVEIWKEVLNRENISITDNFYELGGDSLLVAQTISQVKKRLPLAKEYQWNELMRKMLENPTIEGFAKVFEDVKYVKESEDNELVRLNFVRNGNDNKIIVLYPDGINSLSQYNGLINKIQEEFGSYTIIGVNLCENQVFFETAPECLIPDIGKVIAQKLMQAYSKCEIVLIGYCIGGLMAIETGRFLLEQGKNVNGIVTIDTRTCSRCIDNDLIMERIFKIILNGGEQDKLMDQQISDAVRAVLTDKKSAIVNCAGPSYIYSNIAMKIANNMKIPYVDVFGSRFYSTKAVSISTINVLSAGCYPGFTGILPVGFLEGKMDEVITLKEIVGGRELGSLVACQDVIMSAIKNYGKVNMYMDTGQMTYNNLLEKDIKGGFPENVSLRLYFTEEFDMLCKKYKIPQAYFYNAVVDEEIDKALSMACVKLSHECDESVLVLEAKKISALQENLVRERGNWYGMHLEADGIYNGKKKTISVYVKVFNTSLLSAGIAVEVIKSILSEHHNSGVYYPFEILNNQKTIRKLIEEGVIAINGFSESYEDEEIGVL